MRHEKAWHQELYDKYKAYVAHMFLLNLNVADFILVGKEIITVKEFLFRGMKDKFKIIASYNRSSGISFLNPEMEKLFRALAFPAKSPLASKPLPASPLDALPLLERVLRIHPKEAAQILIQQNLLKETDKIENLMSLTIGFAETIAPAGDLSSKSPEDRNTVVTLARWARQPEIEASGNLIVLMTHNAGEIADCLKTSMSKIEILKVPFPDFKTRRDFITFLQEESIARAEATKNAQAAKAAEESNSVTPPLENHLEEEYSLQLDDLSPESFSNITAGLSLINIRDLVLRACYEKIPLTIDFIWEMKKKILAESSGGLLEIVRPKWGWESIGGLDNVKNYFGRVAHSLVVGDILRIPMGILLLGCPGTGKTVSVEALAKQAGFCMVKLKNIRNMWVGSSERNQSRVYEILRAISPVIVFIDEMDQQESARGSFSGDSGVSERMRGNQMAFTSDTTLRGKVLFVYATNRPDLIDPAMLRTGRIDVKIPFFPPEVEELPAIFKAIFTKMNISAQDYHGIIRAIVSDEQLLQLSEHLAGFVGSDIEAICHRAYDFASRRQANQSKEVTITYEDLQKAVADFIPSRDDESNEYMTMLALREANSKELLPAKYKNMTMEEILGNIRKARPAMIEKDALAKR